MVFYILGLILMIIGAKIALISPSEDNFIPEGAPMIVGLFLILVGYTFILSDQISYNIEHQLNNTNQSDLIFKN